MSQLQKQFLHHFKGQDEVTTSEIYHWYREHKQNPKVLPYRNQVHPLIINPLLNRGIMVKISHGVYHIFKQVELPPEEVEVETEEDEFNTYIRTKLKGGDK